MAEENYNIHVYVHSAGDNTNSETKQEFPSREQRRGQAQSNTFARVKTKRTVNGVDMLGWVKSLVGDKAYDFVIEHGGSAKTASQTKVGTIMGIMATVDTAKNIGRSALSSVGEFTSNQADQNSIDNIGMAVGTVTSAGFSIAAGAAMGGWIGAIVATALNAAKVALDAAKKTMEYDRQTKIEAAQSQRVRDRLGYIETGYSR
jgi:hypothetical protein